MDVSSDAVRRELREIEAQHQAGMKPMKDLVEHLYEDDYDPQTRDDFVTGGLNRTRYLKVGSVAVATAAIVAACSSSAKSSSAGGATTTVVGSSTTAAASADPQDVLALKTASSVEELAVVVYQTTIPLLKSDTYKSVATLFMTQHKDHAQLFEGATSQAGAQPFTMPNPVVKAQVVDPALPTLKTDNDILEFALTLEMSAAATYFSTVGALTDAKLSYAAMTVGGTEWRHVSLLKAVLGKPVDPAKDAFLTTTGAVPFGTGVS